MQTISDRGKPLARVETVLGALSAWQSVWNREDVSIDCKSRTVKAGQQVELTVKEFDSVV